MEVDRCDLMADKLSGGTISQLGEESVVNALKIVFTMIGLRPQHFPNDEEQYFLHEYILKKYGHKTPKELIFAFDLAIQDQLEIDDVKVYDQFTCEYVARIMNGYRKWLKKFYESNKNIMEAPLLIEDQRELTDYEKEEWIKEWEAKENIDFELIPILFYDYLESKNRLNLTNKKKYEYFDKAAEQVKTFLFKEMNTCKTNDAFRNLQKFEKMAKEGFTGEFKNKIINRAKRMIIFDYLKSKNEGNDDNISK